MRIFAGDRVRAIMDRLKMPEGEAIEAGIVTRSIEGAQRKVEARNFDIRKQLLEYDDVANDQRKVIYQQRNAILEADRPAAASPRCATGAITDVVRTMCRPRGGGAVGPRRAGEGSCARSGSSRCRSRPSSRRATPSPTRTSSRKV
jgi:preprotein translocase subunit SecA